MTAYYCRTALAAIALGMGCLAAAATAATAADDSSGYHQSPPSRDGIGKFYHDREIAQVMGFDGAPWLDRPAREREERPDLLVEELHLQPGMVVADIGAGSGFLARRLAARVAPGRVYAVDVQPPMVALLESLSKERGMTNIMPRLGTETDVGLGAGSVDLAILVDVYHELAFPFEIMRSLVRALKPGGRLVLVEYRGEDPAVPIKALHKMTERQVRLELGPFPLQWERTSERLPVQHIVIFRKTAADSMH